MLKLSFTISRHRAIMEYLKQKGIQLGRMSNMPSQTIRDTMGNIRMINIQKGEKNPISVLMHEFGHAIDPVYGKTNIGALNAPARLNRELTANRAMGKFIIRTGGGKQDIRRYYKDMQPRIDSYIQGVIKDNPTKLIGKGPTTPADVAYVAKATDTPLMKLKKLYKPE